ncbi:Protein RTM1 [Colletotrichum gloeosporioides]|uniref:Protein RTM1 n=1 Tax=Colletotrichum gloeosporioides TaxID=474922 RepID=A0A8H4FMM9_COLGL|nr:Protein RTM1 [Colletotrichum gloeosporioides]KAF3807752.1 Protein RTM1 [Colletotrichum gloeosporioides]
MAVLEPFRGNYYLWKYLPSVPAAIIFCIIFLTATFAYMWKIWKTRAWFCIPMAIGGYMEFLGYVFRAVAHNKTGKLMPFVASQNNILLAPVLFAASIYMTLGRVIRIVNGERHSIIRPSRLTKVFVAGDVMALAIQGSAAGLMVVSEYAKIAQGIVVAGLVFHICVFGVFWTTAWTFHSRMKKDPSYHEIGPDVKWEQALRMLYGASGLIMARSVFRIIEFVMGNDGYLLSTEWPLYIFDSIPMFAVMGTFWYWFPSSVGRKGDWVPTSSANDLVSGMESVELRNSAKA